MITLAMDSTANTASCALSRDGGLLALSTVNGTLTHSETLLPMVEQMLKSVHLTVADVGLFAVSHGPGSFTGVRIGVAAIKGLAFGTNKPCVGVSTLEALAQNLDGFNGLIVPVMDARRSQVYTAIFRRGERLLPDTAMPLSELRKHLADYDDEIRFCGDGYTLTRAFFADDSRVCDTAALLVPQNAFSVALTAEKRYHSAPDRSIFTDRNLSPCYLRVPQAERERMERLAGAAESKLE